jgi:glucose-6-phosphate isomerase
MAANGYSADMHLHPKTTAWKLLENQYRKIRNLTLRELFDKDAMRAEKMSAEGAGVYLDYSKNRITDHTIKLLVQLAEESGLQNRIDSMFRGEKINITEKRAALHVALRAPKGACIFVDGENVVSQVHLMLERMRHCCERIRSGEWKGFTGKRIRHIINIASGAADIGPPMAHEALKPFSDRFMTFQFISNVDGTAFVEAVRDLDPAETLFIISSRSFAAGETMTSAYDARAWVLAGLGGGEKCIAKHFVAISSNPVETAKFGVDTANMFKCWDWIAGGYSIASPISLSTMIAIGPANFQAMLNGFQQMDTHFLSTSFSRNLPVLIALLTIWYSNFFGAETLAVVPYTHYLRLFPAYLQQLAMVSNGKHVTLLGTEVTRTTTPIYWGESGINGQHSFYQLMHQGTRLVPCDFIAFARPVDPKGSHHELLLANVLANAEAMAFGKTAEQARAEGIPDWLVPHRVFSGNRPSNTIIAEQLTPETLGKLVALYEHCVFTQGVIWNINSFDHWGTELADELAKRIVPELESAEELQIEHDSSTNRLIRRYRAINRTPTTEH